MRIYINNLNLYIINNLSDLFNNYLMKTENYIELYTNEGIYHIEGKNTYFLDVCDCNFQIMEKYFNDFTLIVDPSFYTKKSVSSILGDKHHAFNIIKKYYKLNNNSPISMILKYNSHDKTLTPSDIYFETNQDIDVSELFIKNEIIEFLSVLN